MYGVTPGYCCPISCQYLCNWQQPDLLQDKFDQTWVVKRVTSRLTPTVVMLQNKLPVFVARVTVT